MYYEHILVYVIWSNINYPINKNNSYLIIKMSGNIHGFGSGSNNNNNSNNNYRPVQMMGSVDNSSGNPREEKFFFLFKRSMLSLLYIQIRNLFRIMCRSHNVYHNPMFWN